MNKYIGIFVVALVTIVAELALTRVFDAILQKNLAYMVITLALFSFGLAGVYSTINPINKAVNINGRLTKYIVLYAISLVAIRFIFNLLPFDFNAITSAPLAQLFYFGVTFLTLCAPFFFAGMIFTTLFAAESKNIQKLYFWDLLGAGIGAAVIIPIRRQLPWPVGVN